MVAAALGDTVGNIGATTVLEGVEVVNVAVFGTGIAAFDPTALVAGQDRPTLAVGEHPDGAAVVDDPPFGRQQPFEQAIGGDVGQQQVGDGGAVEGASDAAVAVEGVEEQALFEQPRSGRASRNASRWEAVTTPAPRRIARNIAATSAVTTRRSGRAAPGGFWWWAR